MECPPRVRCYIRTWEIQQVTREMWHLSDKTSILAKETQHQTAPHIIIYFYQTTLHIIIHFCLGTDALKSCNKGPDPTWKNHLLEQERPKSCQIQSWQPREHLYLAKPTQWSASVSQLPNGTGLLANLQVQRGRKWHFRASLMHVGIHSSGVLNCAPLTPRIHMLNPNRQYLDCNHIWRQVIKDVIKLKRVHWSGP